MIELIPEHDFQTDKPILNGSLENLAGDFEGAANAANNLVGHQPRMPCSCFDSTCCARVTCVLLCAVRKAEAEGGGCQSDRVTPKRGAPCRAEIGE